MFGTSKFLSLYSGGKHTFLSNRNNKQYIKWTVFLSFFVLVVSWFNSCCNKQQRNCKKFRFFFLLKFKLNNAITYTGSNKWNQKAPFYHTRIHFWLPIQRVHTHTTHNHTHSSLTCRVVQWSYKAVKDIIPQSRTPSGETKKEKSSHRELGCKTGFKLNHVWTVTTTQSFWSFTAMNFNPQPSQIPSKKMKE